jgi:hypothetical protein
MFLHFKPMIWKHHKRCSLRAWPSSPNYIMYLKCKFSLSVRSLKANLARSSSSRSRLFLRLFSRLSRKYRVEAAAMVMQ